MKRVFFEKAVQAISEGKYHDIHSILIGDKKAQLFEVYFEVYNALKLHEAQSITKSIQSLLIGVALDKGWLESLSYPIKKYFSAYKNIDWSNGKDKIRLENLLTMQAGFEWREANVNYNDPRNDSTPLHRSKDWIAFALSRKMKSLPNKEFCYSSAYLILSSYILREIAQITNEEIAYEFLYKPLGIKDYYYMRSPQDFEILSDVFLSPRSLLKIGQLVLNEGSWEGKQIVSREWLQTSTQAYVKVNPTESYAYFWWLRSFPFQNKKIDCVYAWGYGGQHIFIFKEIEKVIVFTGGKYKPFVPNLDPEPFEIIEKYLLKIWE